MSIAVPAILKGLWDLGAQYFSNKKAESNAKHEAKLRLLAQDEYLIKGSVDSWKDEWFTVILSLPLVQLMMAPVVELVMNPTPYVPGDWHNAVMQGLESLSVAPDWYVWALGAAISFSFGIKPAAGKFFKK